MAEGKSDLKDDPRSAKPVPAKDDASRGNDEAKIPMGLLDEPNDQAISENSIPLSPQWLYAKPIESKPGLSTATVFGETRIPNFSPQGISLDSVQKDAWRLDTSQDKKEWRRNVPDTEVNRRWREEERETGLLGRRERRKEGDRENEYRKNDRRSENISARETSDSRNMQSSDRWHEVTGRNSGHESRRDSKWSSRWGPEDKGRDSRMEKKMDAEKEDPYPEKQPIVGSNRPLSDSDTRDKWRPRHRQEVHSGGSAGYRAAPGFGVGRGRTEGSNLGFAPGRGRSNFNGGQPLSRVSSAGPIGAALAINIESLAGGSSFHADTFRYPRGKLLDIYRKQKVLPPLGTSLDGFEDVPLITQSSSIEPQAFVKPDTEEQAVLDDIWKGKVASSEAFDDLGMEKIAKVGHCEIGPDFNTADCEEKVFGFGDVVTSSVSRNEACSNIIAPSSLTHPKQNVDANVDKIDRNLGILDFLADSKFGAVSSSPSYDVDANNLLDAPFIQQVPGNGIQLHNNSREVEHQEQSNRVELSLYYLDPQGEIQGPFLAEDIISWYEDGYFGTDLPVSFYGAPEGTSFLPLGEVIPQLRLRPQSSPLVNPCEQFESSDPFRGNMEANSLGTILSSSSAINAPERTASRSSGSLTHPQQSEDRFDSHFEKLPVPILDVSAVIPGADEGQSFQDLSGQDAEEVLYTGRPASKIGSSFMMFTDGLRDISRTPDGPQYLTSEMARANSPVRMFPADNDLNPLGLSWSELESAHQKGPLSSNIGLTDQGRFINPLAGGDVSSFRRNQEHFSLNDDNSLLHDAWSSNYMRNNSSNVLQDAMNANHLPRFEPDSTPFNIEQHLLSQQYEKQKLQQQHLLSPYQNNRSFLDQLQGSVQQQQAFNQRLPDMEHYLKLQSRQRHLQELEQQQQLHQQQQQQQQQIHHRMQLLQQQRQQQLQQQQQRLLQEQLLHQQLRDHNIESLRIDPLQGRNTLDQVLHRQHLLQELQQQTHHLARNHDPSIDRLVQAKFGHDLHHEHHPELTNALLHSSRRHMLPLEQQILLGLQEEQMQLGQLPIASRQPLGREEGSHVGRFWPVDESGQYIRPGASPHLDHSSRLGQLDSMHSLRRPFDQPGQFERNFGSHDLMQRGNYEPSLHPFERSASFSEPNMDVLNALARLQETGMQEHHRQMGQSSSGHSYQDWMSKQLSASNLDTMERSWPESNAQLRNNLRDPQFTQLHLALEKQKRDMEADPYVGNPARWASIVGNDENSNYELADLLHQRSVHQSSESSELVGGTSRSSYENRTPSFHFSRPTTDHFVSLAENDVGLGESFPEGSLFTNLGQASQARPTNINLEDMSGRKEQLADARGADISKERTIFSDMREGAMLLNRGGKGIVTSSIMDPVKNEVVQAGSCAVDPRVSKVNGPVRYASFGSTGGGNLYNYEAGTYGAHIDDIVNERISGIFSKGPDNSPLNLTHGALSELVPATTPVNGKRQISIPYSDGEGRRELADNLSARAPEIPASSKRDVRFRRTSSYSDADAPEASSFIEMLKKPAAEADASPFTPEDAGTSGGKGSKKKGKKGRQIDPSLLGFKVHSNRILMGEIQRPED